MKRFGFYEDPQLDYPRQPDGSRAGSAQRRSSSSRPASTWGAWRSARAGTRAVCATPLQMAEVAADGRQRRQADEAAARRADRATRRPHEGEARARRARPTVMKPETGAAADRDDDPTWSRRAPAAAGALDGRQRRRQDRHRRGRRRPRASTSPGSSASRRPTNPQIAVAVTIERTTGPGRRRWPAPIAKPGAWRRCSSGGADDGGRAATPSSTAATGCCGGSARAAWPTSTAPRTAARPARSRSRSCTGASPQDQEFVERFRREAPAAAGPPAPERGRRLRPRRVRRHLLHRDGVRRRAARSRSIVPPRRPLTRSARSTSRARSSRPRGFAHQRGDRPPRHQAAQRDRRRRGPRQGHRLRDRPRRRLGDDRDRLDHGHGAVPVARAGPGPRRSTRRVGPLLDRRDALRDARPGGVPFEADSAVAVALKQVSERAGRRSRSSPDVHPGARGGGDGARSRRTRRTASQYADEFAAALEAARAQIASGAASADTAAFAPVAGRGRRRRRRRRGSAGAVRAGDAPGAHGAAGRGSRSGCSRSAADRRSACRRPERRAAPRRSDVPSGDGKQSMRGARRSSSAPASRSTPSGCAASCPSTR